jgi:hypothetical protein
MNRLLGALLALATIFGIRAYNKQATAKEVRAKLETLCTGDSACLASVNANFDACFEEAYGVASRRQDGQKVAQVLVSCLNQKAGESYFVASKN